MKIGKPDKRDIDAADDLVKILDILLCDSYPTLGEHGENTPDRFDPDDIKHLRALYDLLKELLNRAPGFHGRVIGGMCHPILCDKNKIIDPDSDTLELHPDIKDALRDTARLDYLLCHLPIDALRQTLGNTVGASYWRGFRSAIDAAIEQFATTGYQTSVVTKYYRADAVTTGDLSNAATTGRNCVVVCLGSNSEAMAGENGASPSATSARTASRQGSGMASATPAISSSNPPARRSANETVHRVDVEEEK